MTPQFITLEDGTVVPLLREPTGWYANHDGMLIFVSAIGSSSAVSPSHAGWVDA